jgi:uncharacterized protein YkwD
MLKTYSIILFLLLSLPTFAYEANRCGNNDQAITLVDLIKNDQDQRRVNIRCNSILTKAAEEKAKEMAEFGLIAHNLGGSPNARLRNANYKLPDYYGDSFNSNQVEAIAGGYSTAEEVWDAFKRSNDHRTHLLGEHDFYIEQDEIGAAFIKKWQSPHVEYWVIYLTKGDQKNQLSSDDFDDIPNKAIFILQQPK